MASFQIQPPSTWQDFERLCRDLWRRIWKDDHAQLNGRSGQPQAGVDVFGRPREEDGKKWAAVQGKLKDRLTDKKLTKAEIEAEVEKAKTFDPKLSSFTIATTAPNDEAAQAIARAITTAHEKGGLFSVHVCSWDEIADRLDEHPDVFRQHFRFVDPSEREFVDRYMDSLWNRLHPLPMLAIRDGQGQDVSLPDIYTALDVTAVVDRESTTFPGDDTARRELIARAESEGNAREQNEFSRRVSAVEAAAYLPRLVLVGDGGSGKSTFGKFLSLCLAGEWRGMEGANLRTLNGLPAEPTPADLESLPWPHGRLLPIFVELRRFVASPQFPGDNTEATVEHLLAYLEHRPPEENPVTPELAPRLREILDREDQGGLLILDGLDETPGAEKVRGRLRQVIERFSERYPSCRVIVTSRPYAYEPGSPWRLDDAGFQEVHLARFNDEQIQTFIRFWYAGLVGRRQLDATRADGLASQLWNDLQRQPYLKPLAERPLMLTMMVDLHASAGGKLSGGRALLYERSVELLLDRWNATRDVEGAWQLSDKLGMSPDEIRRALEELASEVHRARGDSEGEEAAEITDTELWRMLIKHRPASAEAVDQQRILDVLHTRSGVLLADSPTRYRFAHRTFQEYLAASHLVNEGFPDLLCERVAEDPEKWREVTLLAAGDCARKTPFLAWTLLETLVPDSPPVDIEESDPRFLRGLYAALAIQENQLHERIEARDRSKLERIRQWLLRSLELGALSPTDRVVGARVLGTIGDPRLAPDQDNFLEVPGDPPFKLGCFPVTVAEFQRFVKDGGYEKEAYWDKDKEGWQERMERSWEAPLDWERQLENPNHPVVSVSWHEANAYCRWLSEQRKEECSLPTFEERQRAASPDGREYPWGKDEPDPDRANYGSNIGDVSPVGCYPRGRGEFGHLDLSGNVWEWSADGDEKGADVRGGAWLNEPEDLASAIRFGGIASDRSDDVGFRVSSAPASPAP